MQVFYFRFSFFLNSNIYMRFITVASIISKRHKEYFYSVFQIFISILLLKKLDNISSQSVLFTFYWLPDSDLVSIAWTISSSEI